VAIKFTQTTDFTNQRLVNVGSPTLDTDGANKIYVDNVAQGLTWKMAARVGSTGDITVASPGATIDGVTLAVNDRVLLLAQTTGSENGIYVFNGASSPLTRASDFNTSAKVSAGDALSVAEGSVNGDKTFVLVTDNPITLGTTSLAFSLMNGGSGPNYTAGNGLSLTSGTLSVNATTGGGLIASGTGLAIDTTLVTRKYSANVGDGTTTTITVNHALNTRDVVVQVYTNAAPYDTVFTEVQRTDVNNVSLVFGSAPASAAYRVVVQG
jgi:hypothetical protein